MRASHAESLLTRRVMKIGKISGFDAIPDHVGEADSEPESATTGDVFELMERRLDNAEDAHT